MLEASGLACGYGGNRAGNVLHGVDLRLERGEMAALLGPNGAGKSTLLAALAGVLPLRAGMVAIAGQDLRAMPARRRARLVSCVAQKASAPYGFSVRELVRLGRFSRTGLLGGYSQDDLDAAEAAMRDAGCLDLAERQAAELSGGEQQRVALARALCQGRELMLLDEPTSALDLARRVEAMDLLAQLNREGSTVLLALHDLNLAALYCRRLIFLKAGRIVLDGPAEAIFTEQNLRDIYGADIRIAPHPVTGARQAHLVPGAHAAALG
jgi:iron complex transport system ATP-binding protein